MNWPECYIGIPHKEFGRDRDGADCWGLVRLVLLEQCKLFLPRYDTVSPADYAAMIEAKRKTPEWLGVIEPAMQPFDLVRMWTTVKTKDGRIRAPVHIGIAAPGKNILHMQEGDSAICEPFAAIKHRVVEIVRHRGLTEHGTV
ncbi:MAG: hypothetical protein C4583_03095 [Anaerolineaceae bacterium]|nr:MAG: hypothetical protein C4583_03095 [Anaerolineaceae bacterium]